MKNYITEFIGAFFLVLVIGLTGNPLAIGTILMVMVYMGGHISGAHYNPAVTLGIFVRGKIEMQEALMYMVAQTIGALIGAFTVYFLAEKGFGPSVGDNHSVAQALVAEFLFTFALVMVVLQVATNPKTDGNSYYGLAIGFTVMAAAFAVGGISGGAFNPAVGIGPLVADAALGTAKTSFSEIWIYLVGPLGGGAAAGALYKIMN